MPFSRPHVVQPYIPFSDHEVKLIFIVLIALAIVITSTIDTEEESPIRYYAPYQYSRFRCEIETFSDVNCRYNFRFSKGEIIYLTEVLQIGQIEWRNRYKPDPQVAFMVFLNRMAFPRLLRDMSDKFGRSPAWISSVFNDVAQHLAKTFEQVLEWRQCLNSYRKLQQFAKAVRSAGCGYGVWGFIDGTFNAFCRPKETQKKYYSGHKKEHGSKWQAIVTPDGLISSLFGPFLGAVNDATMVALTGLYRKLQGIIGPKRILYLYGDSAYRTSFGILAPYQHSFGHRWVPHAQREANRNMSSYRIAVEHLFGLQENLWLAGAFSKHLAVNKQPVASYYMAGVLLTNLYTCLRGNNVSRKYANVQTCEPPSVEGYLFGGM
jgi:hypothetical protein